MKGTLHHDKNRHWIRFERRLAHPPEKVWRALTENEELQHWFPARILGPRTVGAALRFVLPPEPGQVPADTPEEGLAMDGKLLVYDPPRTLEYDWAGEVLRWTLTAEGSGTLLVFTHTFEDLEKAARDASGWEVCLDSLESRLAGKKAAGFTPERYDALFAKYATRFGPEASVKLRPPIGDEKRT